MNEKLVAIDTAGCYQSLKVGSVELSTYKRKYCNLLPYCTRGILNRFQ